MNDEHYGNNGDEEDSPLEVDDGDPAVQAEEYDSVFAWYLDFYRGKVNTHNLHRSRGLPVRCISE